MKLTTADWHRAQEELDDLGYRGLPITGEDEVFEVLDSMANGEDVVDNLREFRMWRTPMGDEGRMMNLWTELVEFLGYPSGRVLAMLWMTFTGFLLGRLLFGIGG